jgi:mycothiol synthase
MRSPSLDDAQAVLNFIVACEIAEYGEPDTGQEDLMEQWTELDLNQDAWLVQAPDDQLVGYAAVLGKGARFTFDWYTHPTLAPEGLANALVTQCEARAVEKLRLARGVEATAEFISSQDNPATQRVADEFGFRVHKVHFRMRIDLGTPLVAPTWPEGVTLRTAVPDQDDRLIYGFIQAALDRPGRVAPTFERWREDLMGAHNFDSTLWFLAFRGDELVGAALCFDYPQNGWVRQLGVADTWRRKGLGSALLQHAFGIFLERGHTAVALGVEADNQRAIDFYLGVGMTCHHRYAEYRKKLSVS